ncbi:MAG TPA: 3-deoxy-D-manno-octulosonic acid transferase [Flavobacteriaceae bacterium]|nr:3-deoxy-D-manno-octulosonic acid transferase [Flavobacteriaceae bacterium]
MKLLYNFFIWLTEKVGLPIAGLFSGKLKKFTSGRKGLFQQIASREVSKHQVIWFHAASLGEYEQGLPIMEAVKQRYPNYKLLVTFFSPSGYEVKKNNSIADFVFYLPLDTPKNAQKFIEAIQPEIALFIKYEIWPNYLNVLQQKKIPALLISGLFREQQIYFKGYGRFLFKALRGFQHLFVQNEDSLKVLQQHQIENASVSGDTRFDRVQLQLKKDNRLPIIEQFTQKKLTVVFGSTWPEGENLISAYINSAENEAKYIIAPHQIKAEKIDALQQKIQKKCIRYSAIEEQDLSTYDVLIIDNVGLLSKIYSYASIAYVGGALGNTGLHNILEPAVFGMPIMIGNHFEKFPEAKTLQKLGGLTAISDPAEFKKELDKLIENKTYRTQKGDICRNFILENTGATKKVINYLSEEKLL